MAFHNVFAAGPHRRIRPESPDGRQG